MPEAGLWVSNREAVFVYRVKGLPKGLRNNVKTRDLIKRLEQDGWKLDRFRGSHRQYRHPDRPHLRTITIAGHWFQNVPKGTLNAILKQAGLKE